MKIKSLLFIVILCGCSTELDIIEEYPMVPVIYSLVNPYDSVHYVRVHKTFVINMKNDWSTLTCDSLQISNAEVYLIGKLGDQTKWTEELSPVLLDKDDGFFPTEGFQVYMLDHPLQINLSDPIGDSDLGHPDIDSLILEVKIPTSNVVTRAVAPVKTAYKVKVLPSTKIISLYGDKITRFSMGGGDCDPSKGFCYRQIGFRVHYQDHFPDSSVTRSIEWKTIEGWGETESSYQLTPERLFNRMKILIPNNPEVLSRTLDRVNVTIIKPDKCFSDWWQIKGYWENSDNEPYTNFSNSYGLFITYLKGETTGLILDRQSMDTLCHGYLYEVMRFRNW